MIRKRFIITMLIFFVCISLYASGSKSPMKILFIGNSLTYWNNGLDKHIEALANSETRRMVIEADKFAESAVTMKMLWENEVWSTKIHEKIDNGAFDTVVLQEDIRYTDVDTFYTYARKFVAEIEESGAEAVLYMAWDTPKKKPENWITMEEIAQAHYKIASELGVQVAPVGLAMRRSAEERPDLELILDDNVHPTLHGTYLATCVIYAAIFGKSPVGLSYIPKEFSSEMADEEAAFLQSIAWETVQKYQAQK